MRFCPSIKLGLCWKWRLSSIIVFLFTTLNCIRYYILCNVFQFFSQIVATSAAGIVYPSGAPSLPPVYSGVRVTQSLVLYVMFCRSLFVLFLLAIVLFVLLSFTDSDYPFDIFELFSHNLFLFAKYICIWNIKDTNLDYPKLQNTALLFFLNYY